MNKHEFLQEYLKLVEKSGFYITLIRYSYELTIKKAENKEEWQEHINELLESF